LRLSRRTQPYFTDDGDPGVEPIRMDRADQRLHEQPSETDFSQAVPRNAPERRSASSRSSTTSCSHSARWVRIAELPALIGDFQSTLPKRDFASEFGRPHLRVELGMKSLLPNVNSAEPCHSLERVLRQTAFERRGDCRGDGRGAMWRHRACARGDDGALDQPNTSIT
ncbi:hypothetical protein, partial [Rhodoplanes sp. SY1]|uniref:hypothetical protein n=1 Tax=Rhodoplanes sp. SY1 TaxID=3166646 RepID=UPI0038B563A6